MDRPLTGFSQHRPVSASLAECRTEQAPIAVVYAFNRRRAGGRPESPIKSERTIQPSLHRLDRNAQHVCGLDLRHPLDADEVERFALFFREAVDRLEHAQPVRGQSGDAAGR